MCGRTPLTGSGTIWLAAARRLGSIRPSGPDAPHRSHAPSALVEQAHGAQRQQVDWPESALGSAHAPNLRQKIRGDPMEAEEAAVGLGYERGLTGRGPFSWYMRWYLRRRRSCLRTWGAVPMRAYLTLGAAPGCGWRTCIREAMAMACWQAWTSAPS
jgi:hypothetical protein